MLYLLDVLLGTLQILYVALVQRRQRPTRAYVARLYLMVSVPCLKWRGVSQATLVSKTKETRDITLASDWLKKNQRVKSDACKTFQKVLLISALMPTVNEKTLVYKIRRSYRIKCNQHNNIKWRTKQNHTNNNSINLSPA